MQKHVILDIEALGLTPGSAIVELAACEFYPETGDVGKSYEVMIQPHSDFHEDPATLEWHKKQGTWPPSPFVARESLAAALAEFDQWFFERGEVAAVWAWGATYDFPLLAHAFEAVNLKMPWKYYDARCARTVWQVAFPGRKHAPRPHRALEDAKASAVDLMAALDLLAGGL